MPPSLSFPQTLIGSIVPQAVESFRFVEVKVVPAYATIEAQKRLDLLQLRYRILDESITVHHEYLVSGEDFEPPMKVRVVQGYRNRPVRRVYRSSGMYRQLFEWPGRRDSRDWVAGAYRA